METLQRSATGLVRLEDSKRILKAIFPNYPDLEPCYACPQEFKCQ
jgi:hypothetical protein